MGSLAGGLVGGALSFLGGQSQADAQRAAAQTSAQAQIQAAQIAADAARFRPVGITSRFGSSYFNKDSAGNLSGAGYNVAPDIAAIRDALLSQASGGIQTSQQANQFGQGLMGLASQYVGRSPQEVAQSYISKQQSLLQPSRDVQLANIQNRLAQTGRTGLSVAQGGNLGAANPELQAYYNALAQQDAQLAANADIEARNQINFGTGLFGQGIQAMTSGVSPISTYTGLAGQLESLGQSPLTLGAELGGRSAQGGTTAANALFQGGMGAARTLQATNQTSPVGGFLQGLAGNQQFTTAAGNWFDNWLNKSNPDVGFGTGNAWGNQDYGQFV